MKKVVSDDIQEKLDYLNLNLEKLPKFIKKSCAPAFSTSKLNNDNENKIYKYIPINEIEILLTPYLRSDELKKKYAKAIPLSQCLDPKEIEKDDTAFKVFTRILKNVSIDEVKKIEKMQNEFIKEPPFKVKYNRDHLWQIYYSEKSKKYFMLVCTKENVFAEMVYLLKKQIEFEEGTSAKTPYIYAPVNFVGYSETILENSDIADIENYLWLFTKNWPLVFEVYDRKNRVSLNIIGETYVYKNIKSYYKVSFNDDEEALKFYKLLKALFIMQTEIKNQYKFETKIDDENKLCMYLAKVEITYDSLAEFIKNEFSLADFEIVNKNKEIIKKEKKLASLKTKVKEKEEEYLQKQREITTYLECRKTFFGKVKYFFKSDKKLKKKNCDSKIEEIEKIDENVISTKPIKSSLENKRYYTIEDLVTIYSLFEKCEKRLRDVNQDLDAMQLKYENIESKVKNANLYIEEIDKHKKSIFDFWKFANKDEKLSLEEGNKQAKENEKEKIKRSFDVDNDFENMGELADKIQRKKLSNEELDSVFISQTEILPLINMVCSEKISKIKVKNVLDKLKMEFNDEKLVISNEVFDIFGNIEGNNNRTKYIGSKSHRELEKSKFKIMNINKKIDIYDFTEKVQEITNYLNGAIPKMESIYDMSLYKMQEKITNLPEERFEKYNISAENELNKCKNIENEKGEYNLVIVNYKEKMPIIYYTNSTLYDNYNKTLPVGMDLSTEVLIDNKKINYELVEKTKIKTNYYFFTNETCINPVNVNIYEYDAFLKNDKKEKTEKKESKETKNKKEEQEKKEKVAKDVKKEKKKKSNLKNYFENEMNDEE